MKDYWETSDKVVSSLSRKLENKTDKELVKDYEELKQSSRTDFIKYYVNFSLYPAIFTAVTTILIALIKPEYIQILFDQLGFQVNLPTSIIGFLLSIFNFLLTIVGLTNVVNFGINKKITGKPMRQLQRRHIENLAENAERHGMSSTPSMFVDKGKENPLVRIALRNLQVEPVGTNIIYRHVLNTHEKEMKKRGIRTEDYPSGERVAF